MPDLVEPATCRFDDFLLSKQAGTLFRVHSDGRKTPVQIGSRAFQMLCLLVDRRGEIVSRPRNHGYGLARHRSRTEQPDRPADRSAARAGC